MADNLDVKNAAGATKTIAMQEMNIDSSSNVLVQRVLPVIGTADVSNSNPLPVSDAGGSLTVDDGGSSLTVDGTVTIQDGGGSITVDGTVALSGTSAVGGNVAHDAADSGNPLKMGGKASTSEPAAVADGDRVNAYFDDHGRLAVFDGGEPLEVAGDVNAVAQGSAPHGAVDSGNPLKLGGKGHATAPAAVDDGDRVNAQYDLTGRMAIFPGHGQELQTHDADALTELQALLSYFNALKGRQVSSSSISVVRARNAETLRYNGSNVDTITIDPVVTAKDSADISAAVTALVGAFQGGTFTSGSTTMYYFIPTRQYQRLTIAVSSTLDQDVTLTLLGFIQRASSSVQQQVQLATSVTLSNGNARLFGAAEMATGGSAFYHHIPNLLIWDYVAVAAEPTGATPADGSLQLLISRE